MMCEIMICSKPLFGFPDTIQVAPSTHFCGTLLASVSACWEELWLMEESLSSNMHGVVICLAEVQGLLLSAISLFPALLSIEWLSAVIVCDFCIISIPTVSACWYFSDHFAGRSILRKSRHLDLLEGGYENPSTQNMTGKVKTSKFHPHEIPRKGALNSHPCWEWSKCHPWLFRDKFIIC